MFFLALMSFCAMLAAGAGEANKTYFIMAPSVFRSGQPFILQVTLSRIIPSPLQIDCGIVDAKQNRLMVKQSGNFTAGTTSEMTLQIPHGMFFPVKTYKLSVNGSGGTGFSETRYIYFKEKGFTIYIQTDKAVYKPGQNVLMRIFGVHPDLKVYTGNMTVDILDPVGNKMVHWVDVSGQSGVVKKEFLLSSQPVEGNWKISVTAAKDQKAEQVFEVKPYVLPKFEVKVELPPYMIKKEQLLTGKVLARYTYGKGAKGTANVLLHFVVHGLDKKYYMSKDIPVKGGIGSFSFHKKEIVTLFKTSFPYFHDVSTMYQYHYKIFVNATFYEELTNKVASDLRSVAFSPTDVKPSFPSFNPDYFKPGLPFNVMIKVAKPNGDSLNPARLNKIRIKIKTSYSWDYSKALEETVTPSSDGFIIVSRNVPSSANHVRLVATFVDSSGTSESARLSAYKSDSPSHSYVQLSTTTPSVKAGADISFRVESNFALSQLNYLVRSRGMTVTSGSHVVTPSSKETSFTIKSTESMAPAARLLVYCMKQDGEIVVDALNVNIDNAFQNNVTMSIDTGGRSVVSPGDLVTVRGKASPGSFMAFRAVDKSVLLMKEDTDITVQKVLGDLQSYDSARTWYPYWEWGLGRSRRMIMPFPTSGRSAYAIFQNSGMIIITDYLLPGEYGPMNLIFKMSSAGGAPEESADGVAVMRANTVRTPQLAEVKRVRNLFPETWIWLEYNASSTGDVEFQRAVPDTLTTWVASAFAVSNSTGFGVVEVNSQVQVFQSFFVSINLPYSVIRGEELALQVTVFNYEPIQQRVTITLKASKHWSIIDELGNFGLRGDGKDHVYVNQTVDLKEELVVGPNEGKKLSFPVVPRTLGMVPVEVRAQSTTHSDAVRRNLLVEPEGVLQDYSISMLLDFNTTSNLSRSLDLSVPPNTVEGSARATVSVMGDILGSSLNNLDHLVRMPWGCGEQNMVNFAPNIYVLKYLQTVNQLTKQLETKAKQYMVSGWCSYAILPDILKGAVHSSALKGGQTGIVSLTAYVVIALAEANSNIPAVSTAMNNAVSFLEGKVDALSSDIKDPYTLAISSYALSLVGSTRKIKALKELRKMAIEKDGLIYWREKQESHKPNDNPWLRPYYRPRSADIEITAYALLAYSLERDLPVALAVSRWLSQQRNSLGGYSSTQDTVIGLQALAEFAEMIYTPDVAFTLQLTASADPTFSRTITVNKLNSMVLQLIELPSASGTLTVTGSGHGIGMLQVGVTYNVDKAPPDSSFDFVLKVLREGNNEIELEACSKWTEKDQESGMAVMDVEIPSGFQLDWDKVQKILSEKSLKLKRVESPDRKVLFYFDEIPSVRRVCVKVTFYRAYEVGKPQPSTASVYSYYEPVNRAVAQYAVDSLKDQGVCRFCADCVNCDRQTPSGKPVAAGSLTMSGRGGMVLISVICWTAFMLH
ncbi:PREDICTED: CD109 antigen-like [Acropora digitifera]|uniref:CD109 antigen-like n=1 Tax=Acropora digitifera TaxID=70779 RepID=UPI00077A89E4|nr:PREDICTED: CD109 antigen-like [Acropora digitifera]